MPAKMSVATIDKPEFINIKPYNPLISECEIKVLYLGENRNHTYITKEVATAMANSLPGNPIVGYFREDVGDFRDHGEVVTIDDQGVHFNCMTRPYGFVAPDAKVWFQKFEETDDFGNVTIREYLMTTGYLWTGQYPECQSVTDEGRPQSMELDKDYVDGRWATNNKTGMEFFIINDAIFSKLCILGEDVEPCFEGSKVTAPDVSLSFSKELDDNFTTTLYNMMQELKFALKGEQDMAVEAIEKRSMDDAQSTFTESEIETPAPEVEFEKKEDEEKEEEAKEEEDKYSKSEDDDKEDKEEEKSEDKEEEDKYTKSEEEKEEKSDKDEQNKEEEKDKEEKYTVLEQQYETLKADYTKLEETCKALTEFKMQIENERKDALINSFYMLSDEDKKDVIENKSNYSLDDIEAKLSVICVRKKVNFSLDETDTETVVESPITTFSLDTDTTSTPAWVSAVRNTKNSRNI